MLLEKHIEPTSISISMSDLASIVLVLVGMSDDFLKMQVAKKQLYS